MLTDLTESDRVPMSWEQYDALGQEVRGEYIDAELVVSPSPTRVHQTIARRIANAIEAALPPGVEVTEGWAWKPAGDEFVPDVVVFDETDENIRYTGLPHLVIEVLSTDRAADIVRKAHKYARAGVRRYWIIDPAGPVVIEHVLRDAVLAEVGRHRPGTIATLDIGPAQVAFDPGQLLV